MEPNILTDFLDQKPQHIRYAIYYQKLLSFPLKQFHLNTKQVAEKSEILKKLWNSEI